MPYATISDLKMKFGQDIADLLDRDMDGDDDQDVGETALQDASAEIDAIIGVRYPVPVSGAPWLNVACCDLARYRLYDDAVPEPVKDRYEDTIKRLEAIAKGGSVLLGENWQPIAERQDEAQAGGAVSRNPRKRVFDEKGLAGFVGR